MTQGVSKPRSERGRIIRLWQNIRNHPVVYFMLIAVMTYFVLFCYWPMYGNIVAFKNYKPFLGLAKSKWVGFDNFTEFFGSVYFGRILRNTLVLSFLNLIFGFPVPIIFAVLLNEVQSLRYKRVIQTATYALYGWRVSAALSHGAGAQAAGQLRCDGSGGRTFLRRAE